MLIELGWAGYLEEQDDLHRIAFMGAAMIPPPKDKVRASNGNRELTPAEAFRQRTLVHNKLRADAIARRDRTRGSNG